MGSHSLKLYRPPPKDKAILFENVQLIKVGLLPNLLHIPPP